MQINALILQGPPQPLNHLVVDPAAFAVHADFDLCIAQHLNPKGAGELAALVRVNISGVPCVASASFKASTQNSASMLLDSRHARTLRLYRS